MPASGSQQTLQLTLSPWVVIQWDLNVIQHINSWCTLFVVIGHLALTAALSHSELCDIGYRPEGQGRLLQLALRPTPSFNCVAH